MRELLSNNSLFVGQLNDDKSLVLRARDLIIFTTDLQTVNYYSWKYLFDLYIAIFLFPHYSCVELSYFVFNISENFEFARQQIFQY